LCVHTGASALFYSTILNSRRQMALAAALAAKDQQTFDRQIKRVQRFATQNKVLSATGVGVGTALGLAGGGYAWGWPDDSGIGNPKTFFWDKLITGKQGATQFDAFAGNVFYLMPWLYGVLPAALSLKQSISDEKDAARLIMQAPFVHRLMQSPQFLKDIGLDDPQRMHRMVKKMERVAVSLHIVLTTISALVSFWAFIRMAGELPEFREFATTRQSKTTRDKKGIINFEDVEVPNPDAGKMHVSAGLLLATLTAVITTPFFAFAFKPLLLTIWRKIAGIPDMKRINKAIMHAIAHKTAWEAIFATEDVAKTNPTLEG